MKSLMRCLWICLPLCLYSCTRAYHDTTPYQNSGRQKALVAVLPVIDGQSEKNMLNWELATEFTDEIRKRVYESKRVYLFREGGNLEIAQLLSTPNVGAISRAALESLEGAEFALVTEIIQQDEKRYGVRGPLSTVDINPVDKLNKENSKEIGSLLTLALRVRVIDLRQSTPKVILQEVLDKDHVIARAYMNADYQKHPWGTEAFARTPMGLAHNRLFQELVSRVEAYIEAAR